LAGGPRRDDGDAAGGMGKRVGGEEVHPALAVGVRQRRAADDAVRRGEIDGGAGLDGVAVLVAYDDADRVAEAEGVQAGEVELGRPEREVALVRQPAVDGERDRLRADRTRGAARDDVGL